MKINEILPNILHVKFARKKNIAKTFLRFEEYYESPKFRNKIFTLNEFKEWYIKNSPNGKKTGKFTYYEDWYGFNIPSYVLNPFYNGDFDPLSTKEKTLLEKLSSYKKSNPFYIIGTSKNGRVFDLKHEIAHGLFYTSPEYKEETLKILDSIPKSKREEINDILQNHYSYHEAVLDDETNAFLITIPDYISNKGVALYNIQHIIEELDENFKNFSNRFN